MQEIYNFKGQEVRTVTIDNEPYFVGKDVADILGYSNSRKALADHVDDEDKTDGVTIRDTMGRNQNPVVINESGLYSLILSSKLPQAREFKRWVTSEVLPAIRKHGGYVSDESLAKRLRAEAMDRNSRTRQAQLISKFADKVSPVAHDLLLVHATELMLQKQIEYKPEIRPTYSATEIGKKLGISANKVGKLANANNLKNDRFGLTVLSKSKYSAKQLSTFVYYEEVVPVLRKILEESA
uniref:BRO-N domain-containing protein n=1 Tax=Streptococcus pluranimalium TaxID=82348 RepID=UPI003F68CD3B